MFKSQKLNWGHLLIVKGISLLIDQITSRVRWRESVQYMISQKVNEFIEIGPGKVLSGLVKKIDKTVNLKNINYLTDINK